MSNIVQLRGADKDIPLPYQDWCSYYVGMCEPRNEPNGGGGVEAELRRVIEQIVQSNSRRKLVVAGPGTGKTTLFRTLLESSPGDQNSRLALTFVNNLKDDLEESLADLVKVHTLHGYCQALLHRHANLRGGLTEDFECLPRLAGLIKKDWEWLRNEPAPQFVDLMRNLVGDEELSFYLERGDYYDAVDFDDSVYRVYKELRNDPESVCGHDLVLIDEYQDFNRMEASFIEMLAEHNPIVVAGDDDQALYSQLRGASWDHIRALYRGQDYEVFSLPFCMRCPEVIVDAVNDVIARAREVQRLGGRIDKPYRHYEPVKGDDSRLYPTIAHITTTVQRRNANYFGRYIEEAIRKIPGAEISEANRRGEPVVLIIGSRQYLRQIGEYLTGQGCTIDSKRDKNVGLERDIGLALLNRNPNSNLGWRVILEFEEVDLATSCIREAANMDVPLGEVLPQELKNAVLEEVNAWTADEEAPVVEDDNRSEGLTIKLTSFESAKGLSAQHVFIVGLHSGDLPRDTQNIQDLEVCKFLVGLTRAKKHCSLLLTRRFADERKQPSVFLSWIRPERYEVINVNAAYWQVE